MSSASSQVASRERLYALLPTIYRMRDFAQGEPLRALLALLQEELVRVEDDITRLYNSWFVETCDEWTVPYLGELLGARLRHAVNPRAFTANTLAYRRRKGTVQTLTALARDITGWPAHTVEYSALVATAQHVNSPRPAGLVTADLRLSDALDNIGTPFETLARTIDVRARGRYHPQQLGLYVWRTSVVRQERVVATAASAGCFHVSPLGLSLSLWSPARSRPGLVAKTQPELAPQPIRRRLLQRILESRRQALLDGRTVPDPYFGSEPVLRVFYRDDSGHTEEVSPEQMIAADLKSFWRPPAALPYQRTGDGKAVQLPVKLALDPERGRLAFAEGLTPTQVWVTYHYGAAAQLGGGGYERALLDSPEASVVVLRDGDPGGVLSQLGSATTASALWQGRQHLVLELADSDRYTLGALQVPAGCKLTLRAQSQACPLVKTSEVTQIVSFGDGATLILEGLLLAGTMALQPLAGSPATSSASVVLHHSTLVPGALVTESGSPQQPEVPALSTTSDRASFAVSVQLTRSICGPLQLAQGGSVVACDSIVDSPGSLPALTVATARLSRVTVLGRSVVGCLTDSIDCLLTGELTTSSSPEGSISYSYLPYDPSSQAPYRCQPHLSLAEPDADPARILAELRPQLLSRRYGTPGYAQLDVRSPSAIRTAASDQGEPGALHHLQQALRESNLIDSQDEYLRSSLTLNLFVVT